MTEIMQQTAHILWDLVVGVGEHREQDEAMILDAFEDIAKAAQDAERRRCARVALDHMQDSGGATDTRIIHGNGMALRISRAIEEGI